MTKKDAHLVNTDRRDFFKIILGGISLLLIPGTAGHAKGKGDYKAWYGEQYNPKDHRYGMGINIDRCIGCGRCIDACKRENNVSDDPFYFKTWIERYSIARNGEVP